MNMKKRVMMVGSAEQSAGGVASVIRLMKKMPFWEERRCYWLGTQIQRNYAWKLWYAVKAAVIAPFIMWKYDIVHFHTVPDVLGLIIQMPELLTAKLYGKKVVIEVHVGNQLNDNTENWLFKWVLRRANLVIFLAKRWERLFKEKYTDVDVETAVLYNACDSVEDVPMEEKEKSIIMAAYFNENKAPDVLLRAWKEIKERHPDWKVTMMGNGDVERYKQMSEEMGLTDSVTFTGYITGQKKRDIWRKASIYCMCSYNEGFPMVVLEAWAHKVAVVTTPVGGLPDVIEEGKNCLTFPFGDDEALAEQMERLIKNDTLRNDIAEYAKRNTLPEFSLEKINSDADNIYTSI